MSFPLMPLVDAVAPGNRWTVISSGTTRTLLDVATDGSGAFVTASNVVGSGTIVYRSTTNGLTWAPVSISPSSFSLWGCIYVPGVPSFVVTGNGSTFGITSPTGAVWAALSFAPGQTYRNLTYNDGWAAFGAASGVSYYSQDLTTFYTAPVIGFNSVIAAIYVSSLNRTVAAGVAGQSRYYDGPPDTLAAWTGLLVGQVSIATAIAWHGVGVLVTSDGTIQSSADLITWTTRYTDVRAFSEVQWCNDRFIAVGAAGLAVYSFDGITWAATGIATAEDLWGVTYGGAIVVTGTNGLILRSVD